MCFGFLFLRADGFCSSALSTVVTKSPLSPAPTAVSGDEPAAPQLLLTFASGCVVQLLLVLLPLLGWFYFEFMLQRGPEELCTIPTPTRSQDSAGSPRAAAAQHREVTSPASGCPCASSTPGDNTAPRMALAVWKLGVESKETTAHITKDRARN